MSNEQREKFEAFALRNGISITRTNVALAFANGERRAAGDYILKESLCAWAAYQEAWQASRAAVVVHIDLDEWPTSMAKAIHGAIEAAGLKVAP